MAMIENIRKRRELLLILIGLGMLSFLIPYDAVLALFGKGGPGSVYIGSIDGSKVSLAEFQEAMRKRKQILKYGDDNQMADAVWEDLVESRLLDGEYEKLGLYIGKEEFDEIRFGQRTSSFVNGTFYGNEPTPEKRAQLEETFVAWFNGQPIDRQNWEFYREVIIQKRLREKYDQLIRRGIYANSSEAKSDHLMKNEKIDFDFVVKKYASIPDSLISFSESDVKAYFEKNKSKDKYKQTASRDIEYLTFPVTASSADSAAVRDALTALVPGLQTAPSDSSFVIANSETPMFNPRKFRKGDLPVLDVLLEGAATGAVVGPFQEGNSMKIARLRQIKKVDEVQARHILINIDGDKEAKAKATADSLKNVIKKGQKFEDLARIYSKDPGSGSKGGDLGWFGKGQMVKEFEDACFNGKKGDLTVVKTQYGFHLIEVQEKRAVDEFYLAEVQKQIMASSVTMKAAYALANDFVMANNNEDKLRLAAADYGGLKPANILPRQNQVAGLDQSGSVVGWAYSAKTEKGMISSPLAAGNQYVIAILTKISEAGEPTFENVREIMEAEVIKEKKAEYYINLLKDAKNLDETAKLAEERVVQARGISLSSTSLPNGGNESTVIGKAFSLASGEMTMPLKGENGIYVIAFSGAKTEAIAKEDYTDDKNMIKNRNQGRVISSINGVYAGIKERAEVKDERLNY